VGNCGSVDGKPFLLIKPTNGGPNLQISGSVNGDLAIFPIDEDGVTQFDTTPFIVSSVDFDGIARDQTVGPFVHLDVHGQPGNPCTFWGMIIPSS
jgi:hypothetical protein